MLHQSKNMGTYSIEEVSKINLKTVTIFNVRIGGGDRMSEIQGENSQDGPTIFAVL